MPVHFKRLDEKMDTLSIHTSSLSGSELTSEGELIKKEGQHKPIYDLENLSLMYNELFFAGMLVLYLFTKSYSKSIPIEFSQLEGFGMQGEEYLIGTLGGIKMTGLINFNVHKDSIIPFYCDQVLLDNINGYHKTLFDVIEQDTVDEMKDIIKQIDDFYST